jgi:hypothetical protein
MNRSPKFGFLVGRAVVAAGLIAVASAGSARAAAPADNPAPQSTPNNWSWEIKDGKRVPKAQRQVNPDGSWRETTKQGNCTTVKERTAAGEYKESRSCN